MPTPEGCSSEEDSQDFWPTWNSDLPKMDNLRTEAYGDIRVRKWGHTPQRCSPHCRKKGRQTLKNASSRKGQTPWALQLPIHN